MDSLDNGLSFSDIFTQNLKIIEDDHESFDDTSEISNQDQLTPLDENNSENKDLPLTQEEVEEEEEEEFEAPVENYDELFTNISFELNTKQQKCFKPILEVKVTNLRFTASQICTYFYKDLYKFFYHVFHIILMIPIHQFITDIATIIHQLL